MAQELKILFFSCRNVSPEFILITFRAIDTFDIISSNMQAEYLTFEYCLICVFL